MIEAVDKIIDYVGKLIGPPLEELGLITRDQLKFWRYKRQLSLIEKVKKIHEAQGIEPKRIPLKTFVAIIQNGSLEEDEDLHTMWATLLAKASDKLRNSVPTNLFTSILKELSSEEAHMLLAMYANNDDQIVQYTGFTRPILLRLENTQVDHNRDKEKIEEELDREQIQIDNLIRLNLIEYKYLPLIGGKKSLSKNHVGLTRLAIEFLKEVSE